MYLRELTWKLRDSEAKISFFEKSGRLVFEKPITIFVGENGSGKFALLNLIGDNADIKSIGKKEKEYSSIYPEDIKLIWNTKPKNSFHFSTEDFTYFIRELRAEKGSLDLTAKEFNKRFTGYGKKLAVGTVLGQKKL